MSFDPFIDWDSIDDEMVEDLHAATRDFYVARDGFVAKKSRENAIAMLKSQRELATVAEAIERTLFTLPVMVHVAGERIAATEDGVDVVVQRCTRCGSVLQAWQDGMMILTSSGASELLQEDVSWWETGALVAKATQDESPMSMYLIEDSRDLESHEMECVDLSELS